jgi:formamidopyrimidine-DNA glycosylase
LRPAQASNRGRRHDFSLAQSGNHHFMPELPEVEIMRRGVASVAGCTIRDFRQPPLRVRPIEMSPDPRSLRRRVVGRRITGVGRVGKRVVVELDMGDRIVIEPRMSGLVILADPPDREHLRVVFELSGPEKQLLFWDQRGLGVVRLVSSAEFNAHYGPEKMGPDALEITAVALRDRLAASARAVKVALLDQRVVAGIGNIYASEVLHGVGIHPAEPCNRLRPRHWIKLHAEIGRVLREAIRYQGSTLRDKTYRIAGGKTGRYRFRVYQRAGQMCLHCGRSEIVRIVQAQRSPFFCPACQRSAAGNHD